MNRRNFLGTLAGGVAATAMLNTAGAQASTKPNILFLLIDDMGWKDVGFMGSDFYETPNIDKLSTQGMKFTSAYANAPNCAPTRACLISGQYTPRHGIYTVMNSDRGKPANRKIIPIKTNTVLPAENYSLGELIKSAGYATAQMGKWHLGEGEGTSPEGQGFDLNVGGNRAGHPKSYFSPYRNPNLKDGPKGEHLCDRLTDEALKFIETNKSNPFFLYLPYYSVHTPVQAKKEVIEKYEKKKVANEAKGIKTQHGLAKYAAMIETLDTNIGRLMEKIDTLKLAENTIVIFFSDNGGLSFTPSTPLRGTKGMMYEGGIREPMIVRWPKKVKAGTTCDVPVIGIDFYPTLAAAAGAEIPKDKVFDGVNILPLWEQKGSINREALYWHFPAYLQGSGGRDKGWRTTPCGAIRKGDWKLIEYFNDGGLELYNLKNNIGESKNLAKKNPEKVQELHTLMKKWRKDINAPVPMERNPKYVAK